ncbi:exo-alpha-sialidase [Eubacteriales bacterium OttesenSCG-928-A19]|nr:exo-alpha-sialidase [Eubacteriales bacterium OttesenSCG-928-A19]
MEGSPIHSTFMDDPSAATPLLPTPSYPYVAGEDNWHFCHHPEIGVFQGRLYAMWSNAPSGEDEVGQRILYAWSEDGVSWSPPGVLAAGVPAEPGAALTAAGWLDRGDSLLAYFAAYAYESEAPRTDGRGVTRPGDNIVRTNLYCAQTTDGLHFSEPQSLNLPLCPNIGPQRTASGRLIISGNWAHAYSDDPRGDGQWQLRGYADGRTKETSDDPDAFWRVAREMNLPSICEGAFYQTDDGVLHMLHRSYGPHLYESRSVDDGEHWSVPVETGFTDSNTKFHLGRLPDGRFYYLGSPVPGSGRVPLVLSLSEDGVAFDRHFILADRRVARKYPGYAKGGLYGYPHSVLHGGHLYVVCSICKEDIAVFKIDVSVL